MHNLNFRAMGCTITVALDANTPQAAAVLEQVPSWFEEWEQTLSRFRTTSELMQLNRSTGQAVPVSDTLFQVLEVAIEAQQFSDGLVTPTLLNELEALGYDKTFEALAACPALDLTGPSMNGCGSSSSATFELDTLERTATVRGARLDLGGVAKGWAAHQATQRLSVYGPTVVDAGGDIAVSGPRRIGRPWVIEVADPDWPEKNILVLHITSGGIATSGRDYRRWQHGSVWRHHLVDPRTGQPAITDVLSATVIAPTLMRAEVAAKTALLLGSDAGLGWIEAHPSLAALLILENGQALMSSRLLGDHAQCFTESPLI